MKRLRVGVIGTGRMGRNHCRVYASMRNVQLVGVFDQDRYSADWVASQYNAARFAEVDNLINEVDAVSIATPTATHFNIAMHCLQQGVHVLVEKPIAPRSIASPTRRAIVLRSASVACSSTARSPIT